MTEDDDGNEVRILKSKTNYPFLLILFKIKIKRQVQKQLPKKNIA